jgi:hypothetical protein
MGSAHALRHRFGVSSIPGFGDVPLLVDSTNLDDQTEGDVAFSIESSNRKRAELQTRDRHWHCREVRFAPAHANCIATLQELSACTVHEISQPVAAGCPIPQERLEALPEVIWTLDEEQAFEPDSERRRIQ